MVTGEPQVSISSFVNTGFFLIFSLISFLKQSIENK